MARNIATASTDLSNLQNLLQQWQRFKGKLYVVEGQIKVNHMDVWLCLLSKLINLSSMKCRSIANNANEKVMEGGGLDEYEAGRTWWGACTWLHCIRLSRLRRFTFTKYQPTTAKKLCRPFCHRTEMSFGRPWLSNDPMAGWQTASSLSDCARCQLIIVRNRLSTPLHPVKTIPHCNIPHTSGSDNCTGKCSKNLPRKLFSSQGNTSHVTKPDTSEAQTLLGERHQLGTSSYIPRQNCTS